MKHQQTNNKEQFLRGMRSGIPVILGFVPVGIAYAFMARQAGFTVAETCFMSLSVFAGASQMMAVGMHAQGAGMIAIILATFILNLRHVIMSTCVVNRMKDGSLPIRLLAAFGVTDESFAIYTTEKEENCTVMYILGLILVNYSSWNIGTLIGAIASDFLPAILTASLGISLYAMFIGLLIPNVTGNRKLGLLVLLTAVCNTLLSQVIASSWALILSTLLCAYIGIYFVELEETANVNPNTSQKQEDMTNGR